MKRERPILFSTPMVKALLAGRKTQTRRIVKQANGFDQNWKVTAIKEEHRDGIPRYEMRCGTQYSLPFFKCPYGQVGDILWVRETWTQGCDIDEHQNVGPTKIYYAADSIAWGMEWYDEHKPDGIRNGPKWKPSIHMPKSAARLWLEITDIKVERVQEISEADTLAEGVQGGGDWNHTPVQAYEDLWNKINGPESWRANPWAWAISFKVLSLTGKPETL